MKTRRQTDLGAGLIVYLRRNDRQRLRETLRQEGIYSLSGWFRGLALQKLKTAGVVQDVELSHEERS